MSVTVQRRWEVRAAALQAAARLYASYSVADRAEKVIALAKQFEEYLVPAAELQRLQ